ncbi:hypothetical protein ACUJ8O_02190 [Micrococcus sp. EWR3.9.1]|uniref:hypothetical protein n=1 Tax=Micrococcus sp. EWR3.9.1 TaxID=3461010 RepID=UPI0040436FA4
MSAHLLTHGIIHSTTDPYAQALLVRDGMIAWLGADDSADRVADPGDERRDLDGAVVVPVFVEPLARPADARDALSRGTAVVTVLAAPEDTGAAPADEDVQTVVYRHADRVDAEAAGVWLPIGTDPATLAALLTASTQAGEQAYLVPDDDADAGPGAQDVALTALRSVAEELGTAALGRVRHRLVVTHPVTAEDRAFLAAAGVSATVVPDADGVLHAPVASLLADAVSVCLGAGPAGDPWAAVRSALSHPDPDERISARSAFAAATRTPLRALPDAPAARLSVAPRLSVSAPAVFGVWDADAVAVQSPDGRVAAWSTDTRAGTPLLPALDAETTLPRWRATWVDGRIAAEDVARDAATPV